MFSYATITRRVEIASIDEGYFDLSGAQPPVEVASTIRRHWQSLKTRQRGIGSNKL